MVLMVHLKTNLCLYETTVIIINKNAIYIYFANVCGTKIPCIC